LSLEWKEHMEGGGETGAELLRRVLAHHGRNELSRKTSKGGNFAVASGGKRGKGKVQGGEEKRWRT